MPTNTNIRTIIKNYREHNNLSQKDVADYLKISASAYNHYESGNREPNIEILTKLAKLYHLEDQILGVYRDSAKEPLIINKYTMKNLKDSINSELSSYYALKSKKIESATIRLNENQFTLLCNFFNNYSEDKKKIFHDIATSKATNEGKLYEAMVYAWLEKTGISLTYQPLVKATECLKNNDYYADGEIDGCIFDVKIFGITQPNLIRLRDKLNSLNDNKKADYYITVTGHEDISNEVLTKLLSTVPKVYEELFDKKNKNFTDYILNMKESSLVIRAHYLKNKHIISAVSEFNPYKWAQENQNYFFHDASQFCVNKPFVIICPFDNKLAPHFSGDFDHITSAAFRSLCRRMFMGMSDSIEASSLDSACLPLISLKEASSCISAVIYRDISMNSANNSTWIYLNPNARNKLPRYISDQFRYEPKHMYEDYTYDKY